MASLGRPAKGALALLVTLSLFATTPAVPAVGLSRTACRVKNVETGATRRSLQVAVKGARKGHHLRVRGVCHGTTTIKKNVTISGLKPKGAAKPQLDGDQKGTVVTIALGKRVVIKGLTIKDGSGALDDGCTAGTCGGGIWNHGNLKLVSVRLTGNTATLGGGISSFNATDPQPRLALRGLTMIRGNTADVLGGGIYGRGIITLFDRSTIRSNTAGGGGGGIYNEASLTLHGSSEITANTTPPDNGGGVYNAGSFHTSQCGPGKRVHDNIGGDCAPSP